MADSKKSEKSENESTSLTLASGAKVTCEPELADALRGSATGGVTGAKSTAKK